ncbi:MAG: hypothetical protein AAFX87_30490, partial [Bacteroidota bacterium]
SNDSKYDKYCEFLKESTNCFQRENLWLGWKYLEPHINFELFSEEHTLRLINEQHRKQYIEANWKEILDFIQVCQNGLKSGQ